MQRKRPSHIIGILIGIALLLSPVPAYFWHQSTMKRAIAALGQEVGAPEGQISSSVNSALQSVIFGLVGFISGVAVLLLVRRSMKRSSLPQEPRA